MDSRKFTSMLAVLILPKVVDIIMRERDMGRQESIEAFFRSRTFEALANQYSGVWHYSPLTIYGMWSSEVDTGEIGWPEGCRWTRGWASWCAASRCSARGMP